MLARRLTTILPAMALPDALDTTRIHRVAGRSGVRTVLVTNPRFVPRIIPSGISG
jgi:predicted ATPase with chaperone activity